MSNSPVTGPSDQGERFCPVCGRRTPEQQCPADRTQTVEMRSFGRNPRSYQAGDTVNERYRITGPLGAGGFAAVYAAEHLGTQQELAIKLMAAEPGPAGEVAMRRFFREAKVTAALQHPNTVRVFDVGQDSQGPLFMAMELIRGRTLHAELRERILAKMLFSQEEVIDLALQVLDSLAEAHQYQLVHRDLKPANLMITEGEDGVRIIKVLDFGIARTIDSSLTATGAAPGTPAFMSPEQCKGDEVDGRSDLYSLAVLMFACVAGRLPFEHKEPLRLMQMHVMTPAPDPRTLCTTPLTESFVVVLLQALAKKPSDRFATAAEMRAALQAVANGLAVGGDMPTEAHAPWVITQPEPGRGPAGTAEAAAVPVPTVPTVPEAAPVAVALAAAAAPVAAATAAPPAASDQPAPPAAAPGRASAGKIASVLGVLAAVVLVGLWFMRARTPAAGPAAQLAPAAPPAAAAAPTAAAPPVVAALPAAVTAAAVAAPAQPSPTQPGPTQPAPAPAAEPTAAAPPRVAAPSGPAPARPAAPRAKPSKPGLAPQLVD